VRDDALCVRNAWVMLLARRAAGTEAEWRAVQLRRGHGLAKKCDVAKMH
jgi:hypothetical protein